jgi:hypothetical protein
MDGHVTALGLGWRIEPRAYDSARDHIWRAAFHSHGLPKTLGAKSASNSYSRGNMASSPPIAAVRHLVRHAWRAADYSSLDASLDR